MITNGMDLLMEYLRTLIINVLSCLDEDVQCDTIAIRELCESCSILASCTSSLKHYALNNFKYIFFMSS